MKTRGRYKVALERKLINAYQPALYTFYIKLCVQYGCIDFPKPLS